MTAKVSGLYTKDGSFYATVTDGNGNKISTLSSITTGSSKPDRSIYANDGSLYLTLTNGQGTII